MKRQKVLFLITKSNWGGAQRYVYDLARALPHERYTVVVACGGEGELTEKLASSGIRTVSIRGLQRDISFAKELTSFRSIYRIVGAERPDILHINSSKAGVLGVVAGRLLGVPRIIFTAHGWAFNEDRPWWQKVVLKLLYWFTVIGSHATIAVSRATKTQMDWPFAASKMTVINPGRSVQELAERVDARKELIGLLPNVRAYQHDSWIGTIAELHAIKRLDVAIDALVALVKDFPMLRYFIIGEGEERHRLQHHIESHGLEEHIFLVGAVHEAARLLRAFDLFVLPSRSESYGYVLVEAGHARLPTIAANVGGIPDIIEHEKNGVLVDPGNVDALTSALAILLADESRREALAAAHHKEMKAFTVERMVEETEAVYTQ